MAHMLEGVVVSSSVRKPAHPNLLTTQAMVLLDEGQEIPYHPYSGSRGPHAVNVRGRHALGGQRIRIEYECNTSVLWARNYQVLDQDGKTIHTDMSLD